MSNQNYDWPTEALDPLQISLDPENPRISSATYGQDAIRIELIERERVLDLASSIARTGGLYPQENIIVVKDGKGLLVLEGNRRVCACQILLAAEKYIPYQKILDAIPSIDDSTRGNISRIDAVIAPDRRSANAILANLHAVESFGRQSWTLVRRMRWVFRLVDHQKINLEEIASQLGVELKEAKQLLRSFYAYDFLSNLDWNDEELKIIRDEWNTDFEGFLKVVLSPITESHFKSPLFFDDGKPNFYGHEDLKEKISLIARHAILSQQIPQTARYRKTDSIESYLKEIFPQQRSNQIPLELGLDGGTTREPLEPATSNSPGNRTENITSASGGSSDLNPTAPNVTPHRREVFFEKLTCKRKDDERLLELHSELRRISSPENLRYLSLAACMLLRATLEWSLIYHLKKKGRWNKISNLDKKNVGLKEILDLCSADEKIFENPKIRQRVKTISDNWLNDLHWATHNNIANYSQNRLKDMAADCRPVINLVLNEYEYEYE